MARRRIAHQHAAKIERADRLERRHKRLARESAPVERDTAIGQLKARVARAGHLVQQLLALARLSHEDIAERRFGPTDLEAVVRSVLVEQQQLAEHRRIDLGLTHVESVKLNADAEGIRVMLGNLVGNALRYTPEGGVVDVRLYRNGGEGVIEVEDTGPGIPAKDREQVFRRFQRGGTPGVLGSGLGLAIVREAVTQRRGTVELRDGRGGRGLAVKVRLSIAMGATLKRSRAPARDANHLVELHRDLLGRGSPAGWVGLPAGKCEHDAPAAGRDLLEGTVPRAYERLLRC